MAKDCKTRAAERANLIKTGGGPCNPPQQGAKISVVEEEENKTSRKRVAYFTAEEKSFLAPIFKKVDMDRKTRAAERANLIKTGGGPCNPPQQGATRSMVEEEEINFAADDKSLLVQILKNMAKNRKTRAAKRANLIKTGGGPCNPPQQGATISMVEEAAPVVKNTFDSDGSVLLTIENKENKERKFLENKIIKNCSIDITDKAEDSRTIMNETALGSERNTAHDIMEFGASITPKSAYIERAEQRNASDYKRREEVLRIKHFEAKKKFEIKILKAKLENEIIKKRAAELEEERSRTLLEISKLELAELKKRL